MPYSPINLYEKLALVQDHWSPRVIAEMNDYQFKLVKLLGEFVWHSHAETDETFIIMKGQLDIEFRDGVVTLKAGEMYVVPKGKEHRPVAKEECEVILIEPKGVINTGDVNDKLTAQNDVWI